MKALTRDEYEVLAIIATGAGCATTRWPPNLRAVDDGLVKRGCLRLEAFPTEREPSRVAYAITPLGRLALRVSRPEMATGLP